VAGGVLLGAGYVLGGLFGQTFLAQLLLVGVLGGAGIGLAYVVPIAVGVKWFPDHKGLIAGLTVAGFGFGAVLWVKLAGSWFGGLLHTVSLFGLPGVQSVFILYGAAFLVLVLLGSTAMVNPPPGYAPPGWVPPPRTGTRGHGADDFEPLEMLRTPQFYGLWVVFLFSALAGLMVIYSITLFGIDALTHHGVAGASAVTGTAMAWYAVFNGLGRIAWGSLSDRIGRRAALVLMTALQGAVMLTLYHGFVGYGQTTGFVVAAALIGFNFGGNFALFPAATADFFGNRSVGLNYGWIFTAYGVAGIAGPQLAGFYKDAAQGAGGPGAWMAPFLIAGVACLLGALVSLLTTAPRARPALKVARPAEAAARAA
jgi:MFS family permease